MFSNVYASEVAGPPRPAAMKPTSTPTPTATPKATATPKPTSTPVPTATPEADEQNPADQGTLSKPNHPIQSQQTSLFSSEIPEQKDSEMQ